MAICPLRAAPARALDGARHHPEATGLTTAVLRSLSVRAPEPTEAPAVSPLKSRSVEPLEAPDEES